MAPPASPARAVQRELPSVQQTQNRVSCSWTHLSRNHASLRVVKELRSEHPQPTIRMECQIVSVYRRSFHTENERTDRVRGEADDEVSGVAAGGRETQSPRFKRRTWGIGYSPHASRVGGQTERD